ncbi:MAG: phage tail tape measure protein, partial [Planctomycetes bacterium]|nr:phage tail tape measure protein [Planctomycetota bacterium]
MAFGGIAGGGVGDIVAFVKLGGTTQFNAQMAALNKQVGQSSAMMQNALKVSMLAGALAIAAATAASIKFESAFAGVTKTVEGLRDPMGNLTAEGEAMAKAIRNIALETPIAVGELARIGELGGQLGIAKADLDSFIKTISKIAVTTDLTIESASTNMARFVNITKQVAPEGMTAADQIERLGSTIVDLGNNLATTESEILVLGMRLAGAGNQIGLSQAEILGLSGALSSLGLQAQMGGTAMSRAMIAMSKSVSLGTDDLKAFAETAEMSVADFSTLFKEDATAAITAFVTGLGNINDKGGSTFLVLEELGFSNIRIQDTLLKASSASELFTEAIDLGSAAYKKNNALSKEAAQRFGTTESQLKVLKN